MSYELHTVPPCLPLRAVAIDNTAPKWPWNAANDTIRTHDGYRGAIEPGGDVGYVWTVLPPDEGQVRTGTATHPVAAKAAIQFWITELRNRAHG